MKMAAAGVNAVSDAKSAILMAMTLLVSGTSIERRGYEERGVGIRLPGVSVGIGDRY